jgi:hypothetical protein
MRCAFVFAAIALAMSPVVAFAGCAPADPSLAGDCLRGVISGNTMGCVGRPVAG